MLKTNLFFSFILVSFILTGCENTNHSHSTGMTDWEPTSYQTVNDLEGVSLIVKEGTVSNTGLTVIFENNSHKQYTYGEYYILEIELPPLIDLAV